MIFKVLFNWKKSRNGVAPPYWRDEWFVFDAETADELTIKIDEFKKKKTDDSNRFFTIKDIAKL